jgi:oligo-1,6-glucosidase
MNTGADLSAYMKEIAFTCRDNSRTPMQWDASVNAGFTRGKPWIRLNPNYSSVNVAAEERDANSCLNYFRRLVQLRKDRRELVYGKYVLLDKDNPEVYAYTRELDGQKLLILLNFSARAVPAPAGLALDGARLLLDNYAVAGTAAELRPYEAAVYELR